ncbi:MAG: leucyl/phenylalanyl-tRNA--protein transferase [Proteobacteria bacterium]|nr:leucyl/phenylalanyl-tRNA--protein transferase [Pseudomonadota bacterium]
MFVLAPNHFTFPPVELASPEGLLAVGGDLRADRLLEAYRHGIFPWYNDDQPILWWSPDPRATLFPDQVHISKSLRKTLRKQKYSVTFDSAFREVIEACAGPRPNQEEAGTWILDEMIEAYCQLHERGYAHSVEVWDQGQLVGGLYGIALGRAFFGESMFSRQADASKIALVYLAHQLQLWKFELIDCQVSSDHITSLGAKDIRRDEFMSRLNAALKHDDQPGQWPKIAPYPDALLNPS